MQKISYIIKRSHPDFHVYDSMSLHARETYNVFLSLTRSYFFHRSKQEHSCEIYTIPTSYGIDVTRDMTNAYSATVMHKYYMTMRKNGTFPVDLSFGAKLVGQVLRNVEKSWKSYFALRKTPGCVPKLPGYRKDRYTVTFNSQMLSKKALKKNRIQPMPKSTTQGFKLPEHVSPDSVLSARLIPRIVNDVYELEVMYNPVPEKLYTGKGVTAGIDPGLNYLYTIAFDDFSDGVLVSGKKLKHLNQMSNYEVDSHRSRVSCHDVSSVTRKEARLWEKRRRRLCHEYTTINNRVVDMLKMKGVSKVVIGWNEGIKQNSKMGRKRNREFVSLPLKRIIDNLVFKLERTGMEVIFVEESYTSKASFVDNDDLPVFNPDAVEKHSFSGTRKFRGLYVTGNKCRIHADLNGAFNIIRKHVPEFTSLRDPQERDAVVYPVSRLEKFLDVPQILSN